MELLSEDDLNLRGMTLAELDAAWDLWFGLAQHTNAFDPPYSHGVFQTLDIEAIHRDLASERAAARSST
ncbi:MAG: hypothetical protein ABIP94_23670 [Planctomycetota bacterium]